MALIKCAAVRRRALLPLLPFLAVLAAFSSPAYATLAGANGKLALTRGGQIYTADVGVDLHALNLRQVTTYNGSSFGPAWSSDNSRIAFTRLVSGTNYELYEIDPTSQESKTNPAIRLTNNKRNDASPTWSPDGSMIAFTSDRLDGNPAGDEDIFVMPSTPCAPAPCDPAVIDITAGAGFDTTAEWAPNWSGTLPDGSSNIVFMSGPPDHSNYDLYVVHVSPGPISAASFGTPQPLITGPASDYGADWSPDLKMLAFSRVTSGEYVTQTAHSDGTSVTPLIYTGNPSDLQCDLLNGAVEGYNDFWSPDGTMVALRGETTMARGKQVYKICIAVLDSTRTQATKLIKFTQDDVGEQLPAWQSR